MFKEKERERRQILTQLRFLLLFLAFFALLFAYFIFHLSQDLTFALIIPLFLVFLIYLPFRAKKIFKIKRIFAQVIQKLLEEEDRNFFYKENVEEEIKLPSFYAKAKIGFSAHEIKSEEIFLCSCALFYEDKNAKPEFIKIFEGLYLSFPMEENFSSRIDIQSKNDKASSPYKKIENKALGVLRASSQEEQALNEKFLGRIKSFYKESEQEFALTSYKGQGELYKFGLSTFCLFAEKEN